MSRKPKVNNEMKEQAYELATKGFNNKQIIQALDISKSTLYGNVDLMDSIKKGQMELREKISEYLLNNAVNLNNPTTQIFLAKKLRLFDDTFESITLKKSSDVVQTISNIFQAVSDGSISEDKAKQLQSLLDTFTKAYEVNELEQRVLLLEQSGNGQNEINTNEISKSIAERLPN